MIIHVDVKARTNRHKNKYSQTHMHIVGVSFCAFMCAECLTHDGVSWAAQKYEGPPKRSDMSASHFWRVNNVRRSSCLTFYLPCPAPAVYLRSKPPILPPRDAHRRPLYSPRHVQQAAACIICGSGLSRSSGREPRLIMRAPPPLPPAPSPTPRSGGGVFARLTWL